MSADSPFSVSVVIPAFNAERYIERAVNSVLNQTCPPNEIIVVDDGSTDNTANILNRYGEQILVIRQTNAGASIARNTGIKRASSEWIAFLDADDEWLPFMLENLTGLLKNHRDLVWAYGNYWFCEHGSEKVRMAFQNDPGVNNIISDYLRVQSGYCIRTSTAIIRRSVLLESGLFVPEQKWVQDTDLFLRISYRYPRIGYIHTPLAKYYSEIPGSLTTRYCFLAQELCSLVERQVVLAQEYNRQKDLIESMSEKIPYWIGVALKHKKYKEARMMLRRMGSIIGARRRWELRIRVYLPFPVKIV